MQLHYNPRRMAYNTLLVELADGVLTVTLNRPEVHNAFNDELIAEAVDLFEHVDTDAARAIVIKGAGKTFCAGADLNWMSRMVAYTRDENVRDSNKLVAHVVSHELVDAIPYTIEAIAERRVSEEGQEGMKAFLEKRLASWIVN